MLQIYCVKILEHNYIEHQKFNIYNVVSQIITGFEQDVPLVLDRSEHLKLDCMVARNCKYNILIPLAFS